MISSGTITLRVYDETDIKTVTEFRNNLTLQLQLLCRPKGSTLESTKKWLEDAQVDNSKIIFIVAENSNNKCVGYIQLFDIDRLNKKFKLGICLSPDIQGQGIGTSVIKLALSYMAQTFGMRKCYLEVRKDNINAIRCYQKAGFTECGCYLEHVYIENDWHDVILMESKLVS